MNNIKPITDRNEKIITELLTLWELSVIKTHTFLTADDIGQIKPDAKNGFIHVEHLYGFFYNNKILGFVGVQDDKIEMLFISADNLGKGIGKALLNFSIDKLNAKYVDVNEQNEQAFGFYLHNGFSQMGYSPLDEQGRAFPIVHLALLD